MWLKVKLRATPGVSVTWETMHTVVTHTILTYDVENIYFRLGNKLLRQCLVYPWAALAPRLWQIIALCMHAEHKFLSTP